MSEKWGQETAPQVPPDAKFRADLHRALEESHRQQVARRRVGAHRSGDPDDAVRRLASFALVLLLVAAAAYIFRYLNRRPAVT
jgi:hypothetical protein